MRRLVFLEMWWGSSEDERGGQRPEGSRAVEGCGVNSGGAGDTWVGGVWLRPPEEGAVRAKSSSQPPAGGGLWKRSSPVSRMKSTWQLPKLKRLPELERSCWHTVTASCCSGGMTKW